MNEINIVKIYDSLNETVYPKYSVIVPITFILSGLREQSVHEYIGFGTPGAVLHGIIGIKIDVINAVAEIIPEYITFVLNFIYFIVNRTL